MMAADGNDTGPAPFKLEAITVKVCVAPTERPLTTHDNGPEVHVQVSPLGDAVTTYVVIAAPPLDSGAVHDTTICP